MARTAAQREARKRRRRNKKANAKAGGAQKHQKGKRGPIMNNPQPTRKRQKRLRASALSRSGAAISMVSDGVNVGSVWKNTTAERVPFPVTREKIADLTSTGTTLQTLFQAYINPGNSLLFPIFSQIAKVYEQYECNHLRVMYRTEEYMASGSVVSAGLACLATNFDPDAANFSTMTSAENYEHSISGAPFSGIIVHDILAEHKKRFKGKSRNGNDLSLNNYFVNYSNNQLAPNATPAKFYDMGNFQTLISGCQSSGSGFIGELWIEYSFTLIRRLQPTADQSLLASVAHFTSIVATSANNFASAVLQPGSTGNAALVTLGTNTVTFPAGIAGNYQVTIFAAGATSASQIGLSSHAGLTFLNLLGQSQVIDAQPYLASLGGTTTVPTIVVFNWTVAAAGGSLVITPSTIVGGGTVDVFVTQLPPTILTLPEREQVEIEEVKNELGELRDQVSALRGLLFQYRDGTKTYVDGSSSSGRHVLVGSDSEPSTPDENKGADLERSVHISKSVAERLLSAVSRK